MKNLFLFLFILGLMGESLSQNQNYTDFLTNINILQKDHKYQEAKEILESSIDSFPNKWFDLSKELIYTNEQLGQYESNLALFNQAHEMGFSYFIHPRMPKYKPYLSFEEFDSISIADLNLLTEANKKSKIRFEVFIPQNYDSLLAYPAILLLHGGGEDIHDVKMHWQATSLDKNYIKIFLQSYRHFDSNTFGWGTSDDKLDREFRLTYKYIKNVYSIDTNKLFIGGISAGATSAIDIALRSVIPIQGYIAYCPYIPSILINKQFDQIENMNCKGFIVAGEHDHFIMKQKEMTHLFDSLNLDYKYLIINNLGHEYPKNEEYYINLGLNYLNH